MNKFNNPILEGFSPDPSICVVGEDFYLATSTFCYFPGVPIYHSRDLVNWTQIGNAIHRESQVNFEGITHSNGIFAPTLRCHNGTFYMITTNVPNGGNFIVTATDPSGPWSEPYFLEEAPGIDPSLFFDEDGRCYYTGTRENPKGANYNGDWEVWLQELDLKTMKLVGVSTKLWKGALREAIWPEGPHLYKRGEYYYLMIAEGGTSFEHAITVARSRNIAGPYLGNPRNPILTHRHLGRNFPVHNVGHGDLVETIDGKWYMTCLASRIYDGHSNLGRETFLAEITWEDEWPVVNAGHGKLLMEQEHQLNLQPVTSKIRFDFKEGLDIAFLKLRNAKSKFYAIDKGKLQLSTLMHTLKDLETPAYLGLRQQSMWYTLETEMTFLPLQEGEEAGLAIMQNNKYHIRFVLGKFEGKKQLRVITTEEKMDKLDKAYDINDSQLYLRIQGNKQDLSFSYSIDGQNYHQIIDGVNARILSTEIAGGFVGCTMGMYTTSNHQETKNHAEFAYLLLKEDKN